MSDKPLFWKVADWRSRWLDTDADDGEFLHRIERLDVDPDLWGEDVVEGPGRAVCGLETDFGIPGIFARMGAPRCKGCCDKLGIPYGDGAPGNAKDFEEPGCEEPGGSAIAEREDWRAKAEHRYHEWKLRVDDALAAEADRDEAVAAKEMWRERALKAEADLEKVISG